MTTATRIDLSPSASSPLIEAAIELQPLIREHAAEIERGRQLTPDLVEAFRERGFFHLVVPAEFGGSGETIAE